MRRTISQREARHLRKRVQALEQAEIKRRTWWSQEWFGGVQIGHVTWGVNEAIPVAIRTARMLGHAVVATSDNNGVVRFLALEHPDTKIGDTL